MGNENKSVEKDNLLREGTSRKKSQKEFEETLLKEILIERTISEDTDWDGEDWEEEDDMEGDWEKEVSEDPMRNSSATNRRPTPEQRAAFEELLDLEVRQVQQGKRQITQTKRHRTLGILRRAASVAAVIVIAIGVSLYCTVEAFAASVDRFIATVIPEQGAEELRIEEKKGSGEELDPKDFAGIYMPTWIPRGYQVKQVDVDNNMRTVIYENAAKETICYEISKGIHSVWLDDEEVLEEPIYLFDSRGRIISTRDDVCIVWEEDGFVYTLSGKGELRDQLIKMAERCSLLEENE